MATTDPVVRRNRIVNGVKWGLGLAGAVVISPIIFFAVKGIVGLAIAGVAGLTVINMAPWVGMKFANLKLKTVKHEATVNPVETLQNVYIEKRGALQRFQASITAFATEVKNFSDKVEGFKKTYPKDAEKFAGQLDKMHELLDVRKNNYKQAAAGLEQFEAEIRRASAIWDMAQAAASMNKAAGMDADDVLEKIKAETAVDSVQRSLNQAFAQLETSLLDEEDSPPMLEGKSVIEDSIITQDSRTGELVATPKRSRS